MTRQPMLRGARGARAADGGLPNADVVMERGVLLPLSHALDDDDARLRHRAGRRVSPLDTKRGSPLSDVGTGDTERTVRVGCRIPYFGVRAGRTRVARVRRVRAEAAGLDHVCMGDHVSFHGGQGFDGLLQAAALASLTSSLVVETAVYLLALRHPVPVARQVATIAQLAPGRFVFGVGLGGEDRHELEVCGVDPTTRGRRLDEALSIVTALLAGETVDFAGRIFQRRGARRSGPRHRRRSRS